MTVSKALYREFCENHRVPLQHQPWWLDAVCGPDGWQVVLATTPDGRLSGAMPYCPGLYWGLKTIRLPEFTTYAGPLLFYPQNLAQRPARIHAFENKTLEALIKQLPAVCFFRQNFRPELKNWLPFYWKGFQQTTRYTHQLEGSEGLERIISGFRPGWMAELNRTALKAIFVREDNAWETAFQLNRLSFLQKNRSQPYSRSSFASLHRALYARKQCAVFIALEKQNRQPVAAVYLAFDGREAGLLLTGYDRRSQVRNAMGNLVFEAIKFCVERQLILDFEGSMDKHMAFFFRGFGASIVPYFQLWRWGRPVYS